MAAAFHGHRGGWLGHLLGVGFAGFVVASPQSEWCAALKRRDCQTLLRLLQKKHNLWREIDSNGRTVLHVAVMQGCSRLVNEVLRSVNRPPNTPSSLDMLLNAKDTSLCGADVFAIVNIVGNEVVLDLLLERLPANIQPEEFPDADDDLCNSIQTILNNLDFGGTEANKLKEAFEDDVDYNFVESRQGLLCLHVACKDTNLVDFLVRVMRHTKNEGNHLLQALFELKDAQGRTLLHVAVEEDGLGHNSRDIEMATIVRTAIQILDEHPACNAVTSQNCLNARDFAGRTPLHRAVANKRAGRKVIEALLAHPMTDVNAEWRSDSVYTGNVTALHLAVLHNNVHAAVFLLASRRTNGDTICRIFIEASGIRSSKPDKVNKLTGDRWTALELATVLGQVHMVDAMLKVRSTLNVGRCFHLAAARGDPQCLQSLMNRAKGEYLNTFANVFAPLHFAVNASHPNHERGDKINQFLSFQNYVNVHGLERTEMEKSKTGKMKEGGSETHGYGGKKACINLLLQAGVDIWQPDRKRNIADPGFDAPHEARLWWYDKIAKEKYRAKAKINAAGTSTAVVAALIANTSFNGHISPLTSYDPHMNYHEPITNFLVKSFVITNCVSFYVAMTSIMFAIVPSFPLAQEGLREELARSRTAVRNAIRFLLLSIASFIVSYIFSSIAVMPNELKYKRLTIAPAVLGGVFCIYGFLRVYSQALKFH